MQGHRTAAATVQHHSTPLPGRGRFARWCGGCQGSAWSRPS